MPLVPKDKPTVQVWDPLVRIFHWSLVMLVAIAAFTGFLGGAQMVPVHLWAGTAIAVLLAVRVVWGVWGSAHARFADFVVGPRAMLHHARELLAGRAVHYLGHNPLGGWMILALLTTAAAIVGTGVAALGGEFKSGPLASLSFDTGVAVRQVHQLLAVLLLLMIAAHVAGALFESRRSGEALIRAMITGFKTAPDAEPGGPQQRARVGLAAAVSVAAIMLSAAGVTALSWRPVPGAPVATAGTAYAEECGECHDAFNPSLLPRASWDGLMQTLDDHFGEDASLAGGQVTALTAWLDANSAESADTRPAHIFRRVDPANPYRITATPFWQRIHRRVPEAVFAAAPVYARTNCSACHEDAATGWFSPNSIEIPDQAAQQGGT